MVPRLWMRDVGVFAKRSHQPGASRLCRGGPTYPPATKNQAPRGRKAPPGAGPPGAPGMEFLPVQRRPSRESETRHGPGTPRGLKTRAARGARLSLKKTPRGSRAMASNSPIHIRPPPWTGPKNSFQCRTRTPAPGKPTGPPHDSHLHRSSPRYPRPDRPEMTRTEAQSRRKRPFKSRPAQKNTQAPGSTEGLLRVERY